MTLAVTPTSGLLLTNLRGQIRQTPLPKWKALLPLFEAVMNSFQAIEDVATSRQHKIIVSVEREHDLLGEENPFVSGFTITDTGVGFNDENFDSFNTAYSEHKVERGGKGLGRFMWLKAFDEVRITSCFSDDDDTAGRTVLWRRDFIFDVDYDPDLAGAKPVANGAVGTTVRLSGFRNPYRQQCPRTVEQLCQRLAEHFVLVLMRPDCPIVEVHDQGIITSLNEVFEEHFRANSREAEFSISGRRFLVSGFRLTAPRASKHRLIYAANSRGVLSETLDDHVPNLSGRLPDQDGTSFVYLAVDQGDYLNEKVNNYRTDFDLQDGEPGDEGEDSGLFHDDVRRSDIRRKCLEFVENDLSELIESVNEAKSRRIRAYVQSDAPQYKPILRYLADFISSIPPNASKLEIELALHKELHQREVSLKREGAKILTEAAKLDDYEGYRTRISDFMGKSNELGQSALAQYVAHRKIVIELLEKALSSNAETNKYPLEEAVHNILFPMRNTDEDILYSQQNLWIIDERLTYHSFVASDKPLDRLEVFDAASRKRPDLFIFDRKLAFADNVEDGSPISSIVVVEFKRPQRDNYDEPENPLKQVLDQISDIRSGQFGNERGRPITVANDKIPAFAYVVCDITPSLREILIDRDMNPTPDGLTFYGYHKNYGIYLEVIDYSKLLSDAKKRNRIFFDKLNVLSGL
ncbi:ATP-binding protein [Rhizobium halophilum]|uniref:ATP-binding protein n=1 Tax=Rhizobium halophilum TaxID=2846852 RepID=UPI001EFD5E36|nr:ATP-binding protein [Rhizobium halophilum]MCF6371092.1 ATP-binding protein [Rhizobium halophilum]